MEGFMGFFTASFEPTQAFAYIWIRMVGSMSKIQKQMHFQCLHFWRNGRQLWDLAVISSLLNLFQNNRLDAKTSEFVLEVKQRSMEKEGEEGFLVRMIFKKRSKKLQN